MKAKRFANHGNHMPTRFGDVLGRDERECRIVKMPCGWGGCLLAINGAFGFLDGIAEQDLTADGWKLWFPVRDYVETLPVKHGDRAVAVSKQIRDASSPLLGTLISKKHVPVDNYEYERKRAEKIGKVEDRALRYAELRMRNGLHPNLENHLADWHKEDFGRHESDDFHAALNRSNDASDVLENKSRTS
jgi:hypothetical protein